MPNVMPMMAERYERVPIKKKDEKIWRPGGKNVEQRDLRDTDKDLKKAAYKANRQINLNASRERYPSQQHLPNPGHSDRSKQMMRNLRDTSEEINSRQ